MPDRNGNPRTHLEVESAGGELIEPRAFAQLRGLEATQLAAACRWAFQIADVAAAAAHCTEDECAWIREVYRDAREPEQTWDAWWYCHEHEGAHLHQAGLVFFGGTADETGILMVQHGLQLVTRDPEVAALYDALQRVV